ncbi:MAG: chromosome segregation protein SMC [Gemmatimonadales bacterium]|nr:MAG: chromosome segregation protein SMC [Gemmatimonadales bacterium]
MKLRALRLHGFKSFADRTEVVFHDGLTAIVGPNGCGKSNISDAIRWVLGEQRPSAIRGARMEEAIFQGTTSRRPVNRGSVTMEISNEDGILPVPYEEVEIGRTVYRDGGSEYQLNRSSCRLRDIQELCRDTGLGANAYAVIENRMIDTILSDRAEERRALFEEASGIGKYKDRRKVAARRLERAEIDLQRLEDLIGEVRSKVRSLARQKGRAQRHRDLVARRLDLEVSLARRELSALDARLAEIEGLLDGGLDSGEALQAGIRTAEVRMETLRTRRAEAERERVEEARKLEAVRREIVRWERELAVAGERTAAAERRLGQLDSERHELRERARASSEQAGTLEQEEEALRSELARLEDQASTVRQGAEIRKAELEDVRRTLAELESTQREASRRLAQLEGDAESAQARAVELEARTEALAAELESVETALAEMDDQGDLFGDRLRALAQAEEQAVTGVEDAREEVAAAREALRTTGEEERSRTDRASSLRARREALARLDRDREGMEPVVQAALEADLDGIHGPLVDFLEADPSVGRAVEAWLGERARALVVEDVSVVERARCWFRDDWGRGGGLLLLPLDRVPEEARTEGTGEGALLGRVRPIGVGAPWIRTLLAGARLAGEGTTSTPPSVSADGDFVDEGTVVRVGTPMGTTGVVERRAELARLEDEVKESEEAVGEARALREDARKRLEAADTALDEARGRLAEAREEHRTARGDEVQQRRRRERLQREREDLGEQLEHARTGAARARERARDAVLEAEGLQGRLREEDARGSEVREEAARALAVWESARSAAAEVTVEETRVRGGLDRVVDRRSGLIRDAKAASERKDALDREEAELRKTVEEAGALRRKGKEALSALFEARDGGREELARRESALEHLDRELASGQGELDAARKNERKVADRRHELQLEARELEGRRGRLEERLEGEWGRSLDELLAEAGAVEGEPGELRDELDQVRETIHKLGAVNMLAVEEHEEESARLAFLEEQQEDLLNARDDLRKAIREINRTANSLFQETFEAVRENFRSTFLRLFQGGECDLWLSEPEDPLESPIEIRASPRGKRTQRIDLLSGGERALTALSLLFGIYLVKPSPFCVLDEVDAPLDESNIGRFIHLLQEFKEETQFVVITHNPRTIEAADWIYGVTMEEPGVSTIVGVQLREALEAAGAPV